MNSNKSDKVEANKQLQSFGDSSSTVQNSYSYFGIAGDIENRNKTKN